MDGLRQSPDPDVRVRASWGPLRTVRIHTRNLTLEASGRTSWAASTEQPSALDHLLAALAADLMAGLDGESRRGPALREAELRLEARLAHPLVVAGVVGEEGSARLAAIRGSLYVDTPAADAELRELWQRVLLRAPVHATLAAAVAIDIELKPVT